MSMSCSSKRVAIQRGRGYGNARREACLCSRPRRLAKEDVLCRGPIRGLQIVSFMH